MFINVAQKQNNWSMKILIIFNYVFLDSDGIQGWAWWRYGPPSLYSCTSWRETTKNIGKASKRSDMGGHTLEVSSLIQQVIIKSCMQS